MIASYAFNSHYQPFQSNGRQLPGLRLLEGGQFYTNEYAPVVVYEEGQMRLRFYRWGLHSATESSLEKATPLTFAPARHLMQEKMYRIPVASQRCLIPADGYYLNQGKVPFQQSFKLAREDNATFCFAGIYDVWQKADGSLLNTFAIVSTPACQHLKQFGLQMPLILPRNMEQAWLNPQTKLPQIAQILYRHANDKLRIQLVEELKEFAPTELYPQVAA
ncbi:MAG: SOS response-associated peptidase family protein [Bacteroidota bacterium]